MTRGGGRFRRRSGYSSMTPTQRRRISAAARAFVSTVARSTAERLGTVRPTSTQRSSWMVPNEQGTGAASQEFEREVLNRVAISTHYQINMIDGFPEQQRLEGLLADVGIPRPHLRFGWLLPLLIKWMEESHSLEFDDQTFDRMISPFLDAVGEEQVITRARYALAGIEFTCSTIILDDNTTIRRIDEEELWDFGTVPAYLPFFPSHSPMPQQTWVVLDLFERHGWEDARSRGMQLATTRDAVLAALVLVTEGRFTLIHLGDETNYSLGAMGRAITGSSQDNMFGAAGRAAAIGDTEARRLRSEWPRIQEIMTADRHYLQLPARRLVDGGGRRRADDATIDYSIGLEALLTAGVEQELRYRFALRGATVLCWDGGDTRVKFDELRDFYDVRSQLVHGGMVTAARLQGARSSGADTLKSVWWWFYGQGDDEIEDATRTIEARILGAAPGAGEPGPGPRRGRRR